MCGPAPLDPPPDWRRDPVYERELAQARVASVTPTLAWGGAAAARVALRRRALGACHRPALRLAHLVGRGPHSGQSRLRTRRLAGTTHAVEIALAPRASYFWSVRLRYTLDGEPRATRWSAASRPAFRFVVPMGDALFHAPVSGGASPAPTCAPTALSPCACLDFIPAPNYISVPYALTLGGVSLARAASARIAAACR